MNMFDVKHSIESQSIVEYLIVEFPEVYEQIINRLPIDRDITRCKKMIEFLNIKHPSINRCVIAFKYLLGKGIRTTHTFATKYLDNARFKQQVDSDMREFIERYKSKYPEEFV